MQPSPLADFDLLALMPADVPPYMAPAWVGALAFAISQPEAIAAFEAETGVKAAVASSPINRLIDQATGREAEILTAFVHWFNTSVWGPLEVEP